MAFLQVISEGEAGPQFEVEGERTTIGRAADNDIVLSQTAVSSHHCCVLRQGDAYTLKDLDSTNGTALNGNMVKEASLKPGDVFLVAGDVEILFGAEGMEVAEAEEEEAPAEEVQRIPTPTRLTSIPPGFEPAVSSRNVHVITALVAVALVVLTGIWFLLRLLRA